MPLYNPVPTAAGTTPGLVQLPAASVNFKPSSPATTTSTTAVLMGLGSTCVYTPASSGKVLVIASGVLIATSSATGAESSGYYGAVAGPATTVAAGSNGAAQISTIAAWAQPSGGVLDVASTAGYASSGTIWVATSSQAAQIAYTGTSGGNQFTGCTFVAGTGTGTVSTGGAVTGYPQNGAAFAGTVWSALQTMRVATSSATIGLGASWNDRLSLTAGTQYWFDLGLFTNTGGDGVGVINVSMTLAEQLS